MGSTAEQLEPRYVGVAPFAPVRGIFSYALVDPQLRQAVRQGMRVIVPFGRRNVVGLVVRLEHDAPRLAKGEVRAVVELLDETVCVPDELLELLVWAADYYYAPTGEVIRAALPPALHARQQQTLSLTAAGRDAVQAHEAVLQREDLAASAAELELLRELAGRGGRVARATSGRERGAGALRRLLERGWVAYQARRQEPIKPRTDLLVRVSGQDADEALRRAPRQAELLERLSAADQPALLGRLPGLPKDAKALVQKLADKGLVELEQVVIARDPFASEPVPQDVMHELTTEQRHAVSELTAAAGRGFAGFLLHGVTSSGKTEVYLRVIAEVLKGERGAIVLVPEIALTPQLAARFRARFGDSVAVVHSALSPGERYEQWCRVRSGALRIVVGARSAVFAPVERLGVIIVDEEHDPSFKQEEGVRYNARDLALLRAKRTGALAILGSATPSLESYWGVQTGRLRLLEMPKRATPRPLPAVEVIDLRQFRPGKDGLLSAPLSSAIEQTLAARRQVILFLNRRGFSTFVLCKACGHVFRCINCSVSLTHHRARNRLVCHYCGHSEPAPSRCPSCRSDSLEMLGFGTQKVEEALQQRYPTARVARLDRDTAGGGGLRRVLQRVHGGEVDILVGTQMVTKGHDFPEVTLVGVICADLGLQFPDFHASERTFQLLTQVAGRAGRGADAGRVMIQTYSPEHPAIVAATNHDFVRFSAEELLSRKEAQYPPYCYVAAVHIDGERAEVVARVAAELAQRSRGVAASAGDVAVLGPAEAPIQRLKGRTRWMILLKSPSRPALRRVAGDLIDSPLPVGSGVRVTVDVDPVHML